MEIFFILRLKSIFGMWKYESSLQGNVPGAGFARDRTRCCTCAHRLGEGWLNSLEKLLKAVGAGKTLTAFCFYTASVSAAVNQGWMKYPSEKSEYAIRFQMGMEVNHGNGNTHDSEK